MIIFDRTQGIRPERLGESHRLASYRRALPEVVITCPSDALRRPDVARAVQKHGHLVDVHSVAELVFATSLGISATRLVMHDDGITAAPLRCGVIAGVGRMVIGCPEQVKVLASCAQRAQPVLVATNDHADATLAAVLVNPRLALIGLHARVMPAAGPTGHAEAATGLIAQLATVRKQYGFIATRVGLAGAIDDIRTLAATLTDAVDDACARYRFPRPAVILTPW